MKPMKGDFIIGDSSVIFCFENGNLIKELFSLPITIVVSDMMFEKELEKEHSYLKSVGLKIEILTDKEMLYLRKIFSVYDGPSVYDLSALALAKHRQALLATGDKDLRDAAIKENVFLTGTLALTDLMLDFDIINEKRLENAYNVMRKKGDWLPWKQTKEQLARRRSLKKKVP